MQVKFRVFGFVVAISVTVEKAVKPKAVRHQIDVDFTDVVGGGVLA